MKHMCSRSNHWSRADELTPLALISLYRAIYEARVFPEGLRVFPLYVLTHANNIKTYILILLDPSGRIIATSPYHLDPLGSIGFIK